MIREKIGLLSKPFRFARSEFNKKITGVKDNEDRWRTCTSITNDNMGVPIGSLYIQKYFDNSRVNAVSSQTMRKFFWSLFENSLYKCRTDKINFLRVSKDQDTEGMLQVM